MFVVRCSDLDRPRAYDPNSMGLYAFDILHSDVNDDDDDNLRDTYLGHRADGGVHQKCMRIAQRER